MAVVQDRQVRYDSAQALIMASLASIQRDIRDSRELLATGYVPHTIAATRNQEVDARFTRLEAKIDAGRLWLVGALTSAVIAMGTAMLKMSGHV